MAISCGAEREGTGLLLIDVSSSTFCAGQHGVGRVEPPHRRRRPATARATRTDLRAPRRLTAAPDRLVNIAANKDEHMGGAGASSRPGRLSTTRTTPPARTDSGAVWRSGRPPGRSTKPAGRGTWARELNAFGAPAGGVMSCPRSLAHPPGRPAAAFSRGFETMCPWSTAPSTSPDPAVDRHRPMSARPLPPTPPPPALGADHPDILAEISATDRRDRGTAPGGMI